VEWVGPANCRSLLFGEVMNEFQGSAARVGFVVFIAMLIVMMGLWSISGGLLTHYVPYQMTFPSTAGLHSSARVYLSGIQAGKVGNIEFSNTEFSKILVVVEIEAKYASRVRTDSIAWIQSEGLLGDKSICILAGENPKAEELKPGSAIPTMDKSFIDSFVGKGLINNATDLLENTSKLVKDINEGNGTISQIIKDPEWANRFERMMIHIEKSMERLESILDKIDKGEGSVGILVNDPTMAVSLKDLFLGVQESRMMTNLIRRAEQTGRNIHLDEERAKNQMTQETDRILEELKK